MGIGQAIALRLAEAVADIIFILFYRNDVILLPFGAGKVRWLVDNHYQHRRDCHADANEHGNQAGAGGRGSYEIETAMKKGHCQKAAASAVVEPGKEGRTRQEAEGEAWKTGEADTLIARQIKEAGKMPQCPHQPKQQS